MSFRDAIIRSQIEWATEKGLAPTQGGYLDTYELNLFAPLSDRALAAFKRGAGGELNDRPAKGARPAAPAKMRSLCSSSALAVNVFDYWSTRDPAPLAEALELPDRVTEISFEAQFPTGLDGEPPHLDVLLSLGASIQVERLSLAIESKFTEWLTRKKKLRTPFRSAYFPAGQALWGEAAMPKCQEVAERLHKTSLHYQYLNGAQLLKHALGLGCRARQSGEAFVLWYLYFDLPSEASAQHEAEIQDFAGQVDPHLGFHAATYQDVFQRLDVATRRQHARYVKWLERRYFSYDVPRAS